MSEEMNDFYAAGEGMSALVDASDPPPKTVLEQIGPAPFRSKGFPLLGFLATLYEHVAASSTAAIPPLPPGESRSEGNRDE